MNKDTLYTCVKCGREVPDWQVVKDQYHRKHHFMGVMRVCPECREQTLHKKVLK